MSAIQLFKSDTGFSVRSFEDDDGIWFVAKDVAQALGYSEESNTTRLFQSVPDIWVRVKRIHLNLKDGREQEQEMLCLTEQGLYFFLGRSDKPKALPYQMWIAGDVVPSIRRTGSYSLKQVSVANEVMPVAKMILEAAGINGNQMALALDKVAKRYLGESFLALTGVELIAPTKHQLLTPTAIGRIFRISAQQVNEILAGMGYQHKVDGKWEPEALGEPYAVMIDVGKQHSNGIPMRQLKWDTAIVEVIKNYLDNEKE